MTMKIGYRYSGVNAMLVFSTIFLLSVIHKFTAVEAFTHSSRGISLESYISSSRHGSVIATATFINDFDPRSNQGTVLSGKNKNGDNNDDDNDNINNNREISTTKVYSRRDAMKKGTTSVVATTAAMLMVVAGTNQPKIAYADIYDEQEKARKLKAKEDAENAKKLVPTVLFGGTLLSVPFFFPNLVRLGKKFISLGKDDGYGGS